ncbi:MAG TPA: hypothetical protein VK192_08620 [Sphingomicrobium sp.]|nr:hypothetical protein [Sphingomicrobium sp.]
MALSRRTATVAWLITAVYYFFQYTLRSAPSVMMPQLSDAFGLTAAGVASMVGLFYYGYSPFSLVAGVAMDPHLFAFDIGRGSDDGGLGKAFLHGDQTVDG